MTSLIMDSIRRLTLALLVVGIASPTSLISEVRRVQKFAKDGHIGKVFAVHGGFAEIIVSQSGTYDVGTKLMADSNAGHIVLIIKEVFHTKVKAKISGKADALKIGDLVYLYDEPSIPDTQARIEDLPNDEGALYFLIPKNAELRIRSKNHEPIGTFRRTINHPLLLEHGTSKLAESLNNNEIRSAERRPEHYRYLEGYNDKIFIADTDFDFKPVNATTRAEYGHIGRFECEIRNNKLICSVDNESSTRKKRTFLTRKDTIYYGHYFVKDGKEDTCEIAGYKENNTLANLDHPEKTGEGGYINWHIFSKDGKTADAVLLLQRHYCL